MIIVNQVTNTTQLTTQKKKNKCNKNQISMNVEESKKIQKMTEEITYQTVC